MTDRDRKILLAIVPLVLIVAYWFLLLAPKREEASHGRQQDLTKQEQRLTRAPGRARAQAKRREDQLRADYGEIVRLGKAIPARVDMPSLLVQLDRAAEGTGIKFTRIATGERRPAAASGPPRRRDGGGSRRDSAPGTTRDPSRRRRRARAERARARATEAANGAAATSRTRPTRLPSSRAWTRPTPRPRPLARRRPARRRRRRHAARRRRHGAR